VASDPVGEAQEHSPVVKDPLSLFDTSKRIAADDVLSGLWVDDA